MGKYVDGFLLAVPKANLEAYRQMAQAAGEVWLEHGALEYIECVADDVQPGKLTSFPQAMQLKDDETVALAWIVYRPREHRDAVNKAVFEDPRAGRMTPETVPFDGKRMIFGGFATFIGMRRESAGCGSPANGSRRPAGGVPPWAPLPLRPRRTPI